MLELLNALDDSGAIVPFDPDDEKAIRALASQAAVAVRNARLEDLSSKDVSTGGTSRSASRKRSSATPDSATRCRSWS